MLRIHVGLENLKQLFYGRLIKQHEERWFNVQTISVQAFRLVLLISFNEENQTVYVCILKHAFNKVMHGVTGVRTTAKKKVLLINK